MSLSDSKSIFTDLNNAVVCMDLILPLIFNFSSLSSTV